MLCAMYMNVIYNIHFITWYFACMYIFVSHVCMVPMKVRRGLQIPWD